MENILISNTTKEDRIKIVEKGISLASLENNSKISRDIFKNYIDGKQELDDLYNLILKRSQK